MRHPFARLPVSTDCAFGSCQGPALSVLSERGGLVYQATQADRQNAPRFGSLGVCGPRRQLSSPVKPPAAAQRGASVHAMVRPTVSCHLECCLGRIYNSGQCMELCLPAKIVVSSLFDATTSLPVGDAMATPFV